MTIIFINIDVESRIQAYLVHAGTALSSFYFLKTWIKPLLLDIGKISHNKHLILVMYLQYL